LSARAIEAASAISSASRDSEGGGREFVAAIRVDEIHWQAGVSLETLAKIGARFHFAQQFIKRAFAKPMQCGCEAAEAEIGGRISHAGLPQS
jgi:hypothetical protein